MYDTCIDIHPVLVDSKRFQNVRKRRFLQFFYDDPIYLENFHGTHPPYTAIVQCADHTGSYERSFRYVLLD